MSALPRLSRLARDHGLTAYDASYLDLALRTGSVLATRDAELQRAAPQAGVTLFAG
jgi:predicted nucleic acid-binding protein